MGLQIDRSEFADWEFEKARRQVTQNLAALKTLLSRPGFGEGITSLGAELEMSVVDENAQALPLNREILAQSLDPHLQLELDRFNLEYNLSPVIASGRPFTQMQDELEKALAGLSRIAAGLGGRLISIGILPTLTMQQLQESAMTDLPRYRALAKGIQRIRQEEFHIRIDGAEPLDIDWDSVSIEGANTSFQLHLRVNPEDFADTYNAAQLATAAALAVAANSPFLLGHDLWAETRVALFKQSVDTRAPDSLDWRRAARVPFGHGWVRDSAYELFAESVALHPIVIPVCSDENAIEAVNEGGLPELSDLRLLQGTIWNWNRPVYDSSAGGHLRIELRALPSGPTPLDMMANAAFLIGVTLGLRDEVRDLLPAFPFRYAEYNFYRAAKLGLDAELLWPDENGMSPRSISASDLCTFLMPTAFRGLQTLGVDDAEADRLLRVISERLRLHATPAIWQRRKLSAQRNKSRPEALVAVVEAYLSNTNTGLPVSEWT